MVDKSDKGEKGECCPSCGKNFKNLSKHKCKETEKDESKQALLTEETPEEATGKKEKRKAIIETDQVIKDESKMLVPSNDYLSAGIHIGSKVRSAFMKEYIFKVRPDGLAILNVQKIDERLRILSEYLARFKPEEILMVCKRENGTKSLKMLSMATGIKVIMGRYLPGTMTNPDFKNFIEPKVVVVTDSWYDKQALIDAIKAGAVVAALCNTSAMTQNIDFVMPCNNKGHKSIALIYWILAREYCKTHNIKFEYTQEQFV